MFTFWSPKTPEESDLETVTARNGCPHSLQPCHALPKHSSRLAPQTPYCFPMPLSFPRRSSMWSPLSWPGQEASKGEAEQEAGQSRLWPDGFRRPQVSRALRPRTTTAMNRRLEELEQLKLPELTVVLLNAFLSRSASSEASCSF